MQGIAQPVRSLNERLVEKITDSTGDFALSLQKKAPGKLLEETKAAEFNEQLCYRLGTLMGEMHQLTVVYPNNIVNPQFEWNGPNFWRKEIVILDEAVRQAEQHLSQKLITLPKDQDSYGIVHFDIHSENFLIDGNDVTLIDFDASHFNWYAADIASALFFMVLKTAHPLAGATDRDRKNAAERFLAAYLPGYLAQKSLTDFLLKKIPLFMQYQLLDEYIYAQSFWPQELQDKQETYLRWLKERITSPTPFITIDFHKVMEK